MFDDQVDPDPTDLPTDAPRPIRCRPCGAEVAGEEAVFSTRGRAAVSTFFNPAGELLEVLTLRHAPGLRPIGPSTSAFSWFPGTSWRLAVCGRCGVQLGWQWTGAAEAFCGVLTDRVSRGG